MKTNTHTQQLEQNERGVMQTQVDTARVEITELLREVSEQPVRASSREGSAGSHHPPTTTSSSTPSPHPASDAAARRVAHLEEENAVLRAETQQLAEACGQLNVLEAALRREEARADAAEAQSRSAAATRPRDEKVAELERSTDLLARELQVATARVADLTTEVGVREARLETFAGDTAALQERVRELLALAAAQTQHEAAAEALAEELRASKEQCRTLAAKWKRCAKALQEAKQAVQALQEQAAEHKDAMRVAGREIEALHRSREELKGQAEGERRRTSALAEDLQEENRGLRMEMLKVISERNALNAVCREPWRCLYYFFGLFFWKVVLFGEKTITSSHRHTLTN